MSTWKKILTKIADDVDDHFDELSLKWRQRLDKDRRVKIIPYLGYGTPETLNLRGRVLHDSGARDATNKDELWDNLLNAYRHLESDEIPQAVVRATAVDAAAGARTFTANEEGFFDVKLPVNLPTGRRDAWHTLTLELVEAPIPFDEPVTASGRALVPRPDAHFGVISDIDDTVLQSSATNLLKAARLLFLQNARTRLPFAGVAAFYQALQQGDGSQSARNPIFYVSSSPWNLYNLLTDFFEFQNIPTGPLFLQDYGFTAKQLVMAEHRAHKLAQIHKILATYPDLPFVLIGDSGQKDPEIYRDVVNQYPGRIAAVYIRDVTQEERDAEVLQIAEEAEGVEIVLAADSLAAAEHAAAHGLLDPGELPRIRTALEADRADPNEIEQLLG